MLPAEKLLKFKEDAARLKAQEAEAKGSLNLLMTQLKESYDVDSIEEAVKLRDEMETEVNALKEELEKGVTELENNYAL